MLAVRIATRSRPVLYTICRQLMRAGSRSLLTQKYFMCADLPSTFGHCIERDHSPPLPYHLWVTPDLPVVLRLYLSVPRRVLIARMWADSYPRYLLRWRQQSVQPLVVEHKARHDDQCNLVFLTSQSSEVSNFSLELTRPMTWSTV